MTLVTDLDGNVIWYYDFAPGITGLPDPLKLLPNGNFLINFWPGTPLKTQEVDLSGNIIWEMTVDDLNQKLMDAGFDLKVSFVHHDIAILPNGHLILLTQSSKDFTDLPGYPGTITVRGDDLVDLDSNRNVQWVWSAFDHLDVNRHLQGLPDWTHSNAVIYSPDDGNLLLSMRHQSWVLKIDYRDGAGTGDVLWRLGNEGDFTMQTGGPENWNYGQHFPIFVGPKSTGVFNLSLFDNGNLRILDENGTTCGTTGNPPCYSRAPIFNVDEVHKTVTLLYDGRLPYYSAAVGSVSVFDDGNVEADMGIATSTSAQVIEMTGETVPQIVWQYDITGQFAYRAYRIPSLYPGVQW